MEFIPLYFCSNHLDYLVIVCFRYVILVTIKGICENIEGTDLDVSINLYAVGNNNVFKPLYLTELIGQNCCVYLLLDYCTLGIMWYPEVVIVMDEITLKI